MLTVPALSASPFRDLVAALDSTPTRIIDVGAGGFVGETTTVHLVDLFPDAQITAVEWAPARVEPLRERFGTRIEVVQADIANYRPTQLFDLTVVDLDPFVLHARFNAPFDDIFPGLTAGGGVIVSDLLVDHEKAFHGPKATLPPANEEPVREFMQREFGTLVLTEEIVESKFESHPTLEPLAYVEKWRGSVNNFMAWVAFRRHS